MEINEFVTNFAAQFDDIDTTGFAPETDFRDNDEWASLTALSIIAMVDEAYNVKLTGEEIRGAKTINDVFNVVRNKKGKK